jgi:hypothetical protein
MLKRKEKNLFTRLAYLRVIGIANTDRTRDLTPTHVGNAFYHDKLMGWNTESMKTSGGENFTAFIENELMLTLIHFIRLRPTMPLLDTHSVA